VQACAERLKSQTPRLNILINNAANAFDERQLSPGGAEMTFATNVLGTFALTNALIPFYTNNAYVP